jgi:threonine/homoserine/homoserine lactone efflux protein
MLPLATLLTFFAAAILLGLAPGPDNIFVLTQAAVRGRLAGIIIMLGLCTGLIGHTLAVALGVAVIFQTSALAFSTLKYIGAGYLLYLAWQAFKASTVAPQGNGTPADPLKKLYLRGIIMNITNPKVSIFFLAFLPQFTDPQLGPVSLQMLLLGGLFIVATFLVFGIIALLAGSLGQLLFRSEKIQKVMNKGTALIFVGLALRLATVKK